MTSFTRKDTIICDFCKEGFLSQGIGNHRRYCMRKCHNSDKSFNSSLPVGFEHNHSILKAHISQENSLIKNFSGISLETSSKLIKDVSTFENKELVTISLNSSCTNPDQLIGPLVGTPNKVQSVSDPLLQSCSFCGKQFKRVNKHIQTAHPEEYRKRITRKYEHPCPINTNIAQNSIVTGATEENTYQSQLDAGATEENTYQSQLDKWILEFKNNMDEVSFSKMVEELSAFLSTAVNLLPGPKNPATKYYKARKSGIFVANDRKHNKTNNPEQKSQRDRQKRKDKYLYQKVQFLYYNQRRKACRMVMHGKSTPCTIPVTSLHDAFTQRFSSPNLKIRDEYKSKINYAEKLIIDESYSHDISPDEIMTSMKSIAIDTATGPDGILMRVVKCEKVSVIISLIASKMLERNWVPECFKKARTILIYKSGDKMDSNNWRPISICSVLRRIIERVLDKHLRSFESFNVNQHGFTQSPGTHINVSIINAVLTKAKRDKSDASIIFLDISKAFDSIGHNHLVATLKSSAIPSKLQDLISNLQTGNITQIQTNSCKSKPIIINRGVLQGAPLSPSLYNLCTDHILDELSENDISQAYGVNLVDGLSNISVLGFADDIAIIGKSKEAVIALGRIVKTRLAEIGLSLNPSKSSAIIIQNGIPIETSLSFDDDTIVNSLRKNEVIKYLGVSFSDSLVFNPAAVITQLKEKLDSITNSPLLIADQKLNILNQYIWPTLIYPFQNAPLTKLPKTFLDDVDKLIKSAVREIISLPGDTPDSMIYSPRKYKGLGIFKAQWEAFIQHFNVCGILNRVNNVYINTTRDISKEQQDCFIKLGINEMELPVVDSNKPITARRIRDHLREIEFEKWGNLTQKGKGVILYREYTPANQWISKKIGLSCSEWRDAIKMTANVAPVRALHGRSQDGNHCRHCNEIETLAHVLGFCHHGELLRNSRHHIIRSFIANAFRDKKFEVYEEVHGLATNGSCRRIDIIVIDRPKKIGYILDPTIRFETKVGQAEEINQEKNNTYTPTISYYLELYDLDKIEIIGLLIGARGTITSFFNNFWKRFALQKSFLQDIALLAIKGSITILRNHLYANEL